VIDITLGPYGLLKSISVSEVSQQPSLSDHRLILFTLRGSFPAPITRNTKGTDCGTFREDLRDKLERGLEISMKHKAGLGLAVHWIQQALINAYENNCSLRLAKKGRKSLKWTSELQYLQREVRQLFNMCRANNKPSSWELYREDQRRYRKEVRKASKQTWRTFYSSVNDLPRLARLNTALSNDPKVRLGSLVAPTGERTQSKGETLDLLIDTPFTNSDVGGGGGPVPVAARRANRMEW